MKRSERHHLKENEISKTVNEAIARLTENKRTAGMTAIAIVVALLAGVGYWAWRTRAEVRAQTMFGEALIVMQAPVQAPVAAVEGAKPEQQPAPTPHWPRGPKQRSRNSWRWRGPILRVNRE